MKLNIVMVEPEIPQNTGNIARTCAATGGKLHLVEPLGFEITDKTLKRAGLDYWDKLDIEEHDSLQSFLNKYKPEENNMFFATTKIYAAEKAIDEATESKIIELKDNATSSLADYQEKYGSNIYGLVAYILNLVRIYSIPLCFFGIAIGAIHQYVIGIRKLDTLEKGMALIVSFVTILIICQILPLAFAVFVKFGRG